MGVLDVLKSAIVQFFYNDSTLFSSLPMYEQQVIYFFSVTISIVMMLAFFKFILRFFRI